MRRTPQENDVMIETLVRRFEAQKPSIYVMERYMEGSKVGDFGCGNGVPLQFLAERHPEKIFVGLDHSADILQKSVASGARNVVLVQAPMTEPVFPDASFDAVICSKSLHEVFSLLGVDGLRDALCVIFGYLRPGGHLLIYENVVRDRERVEIEFLTLETRETFERFVRDYKIRPVEFSADWPRVSLRRDDALDFLTKYRDPNWDSEMEEAHFIFTLDEWHEVVGEAGFLHRLSQSAEDHGILATDGVRLNWHVDDFKHVMVFQKP